MLLLDVPASSDPRNPSTRICPFELCAFTSPSTSSSSIEPLLVCASRLPRNACAWICPLDDFQRAGPSPSTVRMAPLDVVIRSSTAWRGTLMTNRAPQLPPRIEGRTTRMETRSGLLSISTFSESASSWERAYLEEADSLKVEIDN